MPVLGWAVVTVALCWYQLWSRRSVAHLVFCCEDARQAYRHKELVWSDLVKGWTLTTIPLRSQSGTAKWFGWERNLENHAGEPYRFGEICPFCRSEGLPYGHAMLTGGDDGPPQE